MAMFVHLTSAANAPRIRRSGIRAVSHGQGGARGVYCFPVLPSYTLTHQWLRELARFGTRGGLVAVHVRVDDAQDVFVGRYGDRVLGAQAAVPAAEAVRRIGALEDPRGWEVFVPRAIRPREVHRVRPAPQVAGWRYVPDAHGRRPCTCFGCRERGGYGARRLRERLPHPLDGPPPPVRVLLARVEAADPGDPAALREALYWFGMRRRGPLAELSRLAGHPDPRVRQDLVWAVGRWTTPGVAELLDGLAEDPHADVRAAVEEVRDPECRRIPEPPGARSVGDALRLERR
ncbi:HEAT repeat domain-containing protein [Streptomyces showdoensis]|uniref:HEAT repeat domain-containing protein n=1 Tax=Streptomyces showdoensis TaxID=68268 RepID=UPI001969A717|nr:HEAT repeat domain-containing protein [Streptomyces showdoensis]